MKAGVRGRYYDFGYGFRPGCFIGSKEKFTRRGPGTMKTPAVRLREWPSNVPIQDPVDRRMAVRVQVILLVFMAIIVMAAILNLLIPDSLPWGLS
jgi:hypothetical protein